MTAERPTCEKCGRLKRRNAVRNGRTYYICRHRGTPRDPSALAARPWCVRCRRPMNRGGRRFTCIGCGVTCYVDKRPRLIYTPDRPACKRPMRRRLDKHRGRVCLYFTCSSCAALRRRLREDSETAAALLRQIAAALPGYLTLEEREDASHSIYLDMLAGKLAPVVPSPHMLRRYAARARGMTSDQYRFISLSSPTPDGREFGETLAA